MKREVIVSCKAKLYHLYALEKMQIIKSSRINFIKDSAINMRKIHNIL